MRLILIERYGSSDGDVITLLNFLSAGLLLVNYWYTVGRQLADSIPTVGRQTFRGALLHFYRSDRQHGPGNWQQSSQEALIIIDRKKGNNFDSSNLFFFPKNRTRHLFTFAFWLFWQSSNKLFSVNSKHILVFECESNCCTYCCKAVEKYAPLGIIRIVWFFSIASTTFDAAYSGVNILNPNKWGNLINKDNNNYNYNQL